MAVLPGITVVDADLEAVVPAITKDLLHSLEGKGDFSEHILRAKGRVHDEIQLSGGYSNADMAKVKDSTSGATSLRIVHFAISYVYAANELLEKAEYWEQQAIGSQLVYHFDKNEDGIIDEDETIYKPTKFGR